MFTRTGSQQFQIKPSDQRHADESPDVSETNAQLPKEEVIILDTGALDGRQSQTSSSYVNEAFETREEGTTNSDNLSRDPHLPDKVADVKTYRWKNGKKGMRSVIECKETVKTWRASHAVCIRRTLKILLLCLYNVYLGFAIHLTWFREASWCEGVKFLSLLTAVPYLCAFHVIVGKPYLWKPLGRAFAPAFVWLSRIKHIDKISWLIAWIAVVVFLVIDTQQDRYRLVSAGGLIVLLLLGYVFSEHPTKVAWRSVQCGVMVQFVFGLLILRWEVGRAVFECLGKKVKVFLEFADRGSAFVFGYLVTGHLDGAPEQAAIFAFKVLCTIVFFSFLVSILYYYGLMQILVINLGWLLQKVMGTTACESMNAASNVFLGMTEAPLVIRPYLPKMTKSELHAVLTGGFATIAGSVMAAYVSFGVNASHLLSASVMSAPAALAFSKLFYPETEESTTKAENISVDLPKEANALEAASNGASNAIFLVSNVAANLVAFVAFIALMDSIVSWFGSLVYWDFISFEWLISKLFIPISLLMGVSWEDKEKVANLIGLKTVINEFVAYNKLSTLQKSNLISPRSQAIATFALCGFSNFSSIGIQLGALGAMAPERKSDLASLALRAMIAGSAACFMTACIAGALLTTVD